MTVGWLPTPIAGVLFSEVAVGRDFRGSGMQVLDTAGLAGVGVTFFPQEAFLVTSLPRVLRGMHGQSAPHRHAKLVTCVEGQVHDVLLDLRPDSSTFRTSAAFELSGETGGRLYIPEGVLHGFCVLGDSPSKVLVQVSSPHVGTASVGVRWDTFGHTWPVEAPVLSERDTALPSLESILKTFV